MQTVTIGLVEDDELLRESLTLMLENVGGFVVAGAVGTLAEGLSLLDRQLDVMLVDLGLPDGSGFSLIPELRRLPDGPRIIVLTSRDEDVECVAALEAGADDFVTKPFSPRALAARVRAVARRATNSEEN